MNYNTSWLPVAGGAIGYVLVYKSWGPRFESACRMEVSQGKQKCNLDEIISLQLFSTYT